MTTITATPATPPADLGNRTPYTRLGVFGLGLIGTAVAMFIVAALFSKPEDVAFMAPVLLVVVLLAGLTWRFGTWAKVLAIVGCGLAGLAMYWTVFGLAFPASPFDFLPGMLVPIGVVLGIAGNAAAIRHRRERVPAALPVERRIMAGVLAIVLVAAGASVIAALASRSTIEPATGDVVVEINAFAFPELVEAQVGDQLLVHNGDAAMHDFAVPALGIDLDVLPGSDGVIDLAEVAPGTYTVYCTLHSNTSDPEPGTAGMATTLQIAAP